MPADGSVGGTNDAAINSMDVAQPRSEREQLVMLLDGVVSRLLSVQKRRPWSVTLGQLLHHQEEIARGAEELTEALMDRLLELMDAADKLTDDGRDDSAVTLARDLWPRESGVQPSPVLFEVDAEHGAHIARAILAGQMVPAPLEPAPPAGERMRCIIEVEGYVSPLMLWAESTGICVPDGVLLLLAPIDGDERDRLAFVSEHRTLPPETEPLPSITGPSITVPSITVPDGRDTIPDSFRSVEIRFEDLFEDVVEESYDDCRLSREAIAPPPSVATTCTIASDAMS